MALSSRRPIGKGGGLRPPPFPMGFSVGGGHLDPPKSTISGPRPETWDKDKFWSSQDGPLKLTVSQAAILHCSFWLGPGIRHEMTLYWSTVLILCVLCTIFRS